MQNVICLERCDKLSVFEITSYSLGCIVYVKHEVNVYLMSSSVMQLSILK